MAEHNELGKEGELVAIDFLKRNGYTILETNWRWQKAEVDIIASKGKILAIIEVKTRSSIEFGLPQDFVKNKKIQLLIQAIDYYIVNNDLEVDARFDIIAIHKSENQYNIEHLEDAFFIF